MNGQGKLLTHYLKNADKLIIPVYQRNYDWKEEQCRKLYKDLVFTIEKNRRWHFFGGIVSVSDPMGSSSDYLIIDGQQRITTVSLLLLAMANAIKDGKVVPKDSELYDKITKRYLVDEINPKNRKMKLKPIKGDQNAYDRLWGDPADYERASNITQNYLYFYNEVLKCEIAVDQLFAAVERLQIIDITLTPPDDDPQLVFESLNSTGLDLNEGDKIRNYVLMGLDPERQEEYYDKYWSPIEKNAGYDKQNNSYDVSPFVRDYLGIKLRKIVSMKDIYPEFKALAEKHDGEMEKIMEDLLAYAKRFNRVVSGHPSFPVKLRASIARLNRFESSVTRPFLMEVMRLQEEGSLTLDEVTEVFRTIESYLLRRVICDLPSNTLSKVFLTLFSDIRRLDGTDTQFVDKMKFVLAGKREKAAFPDDTEFAQGIHEKNIYAMPPRYKAYIFERFENGDSSEVKDIYARLDSGEYSIEHIMPQKITPAWSTELGLDAETIHSEWLHRLANLTLTAYNSKYSNNSFNDKKTMEDGYLKSGIRMNQLVAQKEHWGLNELRERSDELTRQALALWPYVETAYTPPQRQYDEIALDDDVVFTGKTIVKYRFRGVEHETTTWSQMFSDVVKELHDNDRSYLNYLADADDTVEMAAHVSRGKESSSSYYKIDDDLYIFTATSTQSKIMVLRKLFEHYGQDGSELVFFTDEAKETSHEGEAARYQLRREYWEKALPIVQATTGTFLNVAPSKNNTISGATGTPGVFVNCIANYDSARVQIYVDTGDLNTTKQIFNKLASHRQEIESAYGKALTWVDDESTRAARFYDETQALNIQDEDEWESLAKFHADKAKALLDATAKFL